MRYILDLSAELAAAIDEQIRSGRYKSPQHFMITAIHNQVYIESQETTNLQAEVIGQPESPSSIAPVSVPRFAGISRNDLLSRDVSGAKTVHLVTADRPSRLWGQYNRFFPVKVAVRVAANLAKKSSNGYMPLGELQETSAQIARELGKEIERRDKALGRKRGTIISAGLPLGKALDKTMARFKNQFVGYMAGNRIEGATPALKFLDIARDERNLVVAGVTNDGLDFASLPNPILDSADYSSSLSQPEVEFLLKHIAKEVPKEAELMKVILAAIKHGVDTPEALNERVGEFLRDWKRNEVIMMRAGLVSRMSELDLLDREKAGVKVTYVLTEKGEKYLERLAAS